jgi:hypothetical protein
VHFDAEERLLAIVDERSARFETLPARHPRQLPLALPQRFFGARLMDVKTRQFVELPEFGEGGIHPWDAAGGPSLLEGPCGSWVRCACPNLLAPPRRLGLAEASVRCVARRHRATVPEFSYSGANALVSQSASLEVRSPN